jgi:hypothetical protein
MLQFETKDCKDKAYATVERVRYDGCLRDMFTPIQMPNDNAFITSTVGKKMNLDRLPFKIQEHMHPVDLSGKTDDEIICSTTNARRTGKNGTRHGTI